MKIKDITSFLEGIAPTSLQETYDNAGLLTGNFNWDCTGIITCLDATEDVVAEAIEKKCNLIVAHHPIIFGGLKKITGKNYVEKIIITAIKNDIAIYAIHTNLDNVQDGVNGKIAALVGLKNIQILAPKAGQLKKLYTYVPIQFAEKIRAAIFEAGGGQISNYSECSFSTQGKGTFKAGENSNPYTGKIGEQHTELEEKIEIIFPFWKENEILKALFNAHPYQEVAYDIITLDNMLQSIGAGIIGELAAPMKELDFLNNIKNIFNTKIIRHSVLLNKMVQKVAICGGAGSFLISAACAASADFYITSDVKYHEFFDANAQLVIADIGHFESEQFTIDLLFDNLTKKFPNFAVLKTRVNTNSVHYFL